MNTDNYYIGIDGGGTHCRARLEDANGNLLGIGLSGSANVMRDLNTAKESIVSACQQACQEALTNAKLAVPLNQLVVGAGLAGANVPSAHIAISNWHHPFKGFSVVSDLHAACLGAHEGDAGAVIICGTGSSGTRYLDGKFEDFGGHGFFIGDIASGAWLGLNAVQHTLKVLDGLYPSNGLSQAVCHQLECFDVMSMVQEVEDYMPKDYARLAPVVVNQVYHNQPDASEIFDIGCRYLQRLASQLLAGHEHHLALIGGLSEIFAPHFSAEVQARIVPCRYSPEQGAIFHVQQAYGIQETGK